jgi:hypothetical protein
MLQAGSACCRAGAKLSDGGISLLDEIVACAKQTTTGQVPLLSGLIVPYSDHLPPGYRLDLLDGNIPTTDLQ